MFPRVKNEDVSLPERKTCSGNGPRIPVIPLIKYNL
jgi:hypothetical protein